MDMILLFFFMAFLIESSVEHFAQAVPSRFKPYVALVLAFLLCLGLQIDMVEAIFTRMFNREFPYPFVGEFVTALVVSRGSNFVNDVFSRIGVMPRPATTVDNVEATTPVQKSGDTAKLYN